MLWLVVLGTKHSLLAGTALVLLYRKMKVLLKFIRSMVRLYIGIDLRSLVWDKTSTIMLFSTSHFSILEDFELEVNSRMEF